MSLLVLTQNLASVAVTSTVSVQHSNRTGPWDGKHALHIEQLAKKSMPWLSNPWDWGKNPRGPLLTT